MIYRQRKDTGEMNTRLSILFFLLINIFLGIVGTFWFRTRQRQGEIGMVITYLLIALMIIAGIWYSANKAACLEPVEALHCE